VKKNYVLLFALAIASSACGGLQTNSLSYTVQSLGVSHLEKPSADLNVSGSFVKKTPLTATLDVGSPTDTNVTLSFVAPSSVNLSQSNLNIHLLAGETKRITVYATPQRRGSFDISAQITPDTVWEQQADLGTGVFFNVVASASEANTKSNGPSAAGVSKPTTYIDNLPDAPANLYQMQESDRLYGTDDAVLDAKQHGMTYQIRPAGARAKDAPETITVPGEYISTFLPNTGSGHPEPGELEGLPPSQKALSTKERQARNLFCGGDHLSTIKLNMKSPSYLGTNGFGGYNLTHVKVQVFDNNGNFNTLIAQGFTNTNGEYSFIKPNCDLSSWFDWSPPDIFYVISGETDNGLQTNVSRIFATTASFSTGTDWEDRSAARQYDLNTAEAVHTRALFTSNIMVQKAREINQLSGNINLTNFPVRIHEFFDTFAPVGVIFYGGTTYETGASDAFNGYASPYMIYHEFGHNIMWATRNRTAYDTTFYNPTLPIASPGYEDEQCIAIAFVVGSVFTPAGGLAAFIACMTQVYTHNGTDLKDEKLAWSEGWANYFNNVALLYLYKTDKEPVYLNYLSGQIRNNLYCDSSIYCSSQFNTDTDQQGNRNETRVGSFLTRYTIEILAKIKKPTNPNDSTSFKSWIDTTLTLNDVTSILTQYARIRDNVVGVNGYLMGLNAHWNALYGLKPADANISDICKIAFETRVISKNTPMPCNANGTVK
jgi:hypothetical protein